MSSQESMMKESLPEPTSPEYQSFNLFLEQALPIDVSFNVPHTRDSRGYSIPIMNKRYNSMEIVTVSANQTEFSPRFLYSLIAVVAGGGGEVFFM